MGKLQVHHLRAGEDELQGSHQGEIRQSGTSGQPLQTSHFSLWSYQRILDRTGDSAKAVKFCFVNLSPHQQAHLQNLVRWASSTFNFFPVSKEYYNKSKKAMQNIPRRSV